MGLQQGQDAIHWVRMLRPCCGPVAILRRNWPLPIKSAAKFSRSIFSDSARLSDRIENCGSKINCRPRQGSREFCFGGTSRTVSIHYKIPFRQFAVCLLLAAQLLLLRACQENGQRRSSHLPNMPFAVRYRFATFESMTTDPYERFPSLSRAPVREDMCPCYVDPPA